MLKLDLKLVLIIVFAVLAGLVVCFGRMPSDTTMIAAVALLIPCSVFVYRYPVLLIVAFLYVGRFKTQPASGISLSDPTLIIVLVLSVVIGFDFLSSFAQPHGGTLFDRFAGQGHAVLLYLAFFMVVAASYLHTIAPTAGAQKLMRFSVFETLAFLAPFFLLRQRRDFRVFFYGTLAGSAILCVKLIMTLMHPTEGQLLGQEDITRIGDAGLIGATALMGLYSRFPGRYAPAIPFLAVPALVVGVIASEARGPFFSLVLAVLICSTVIPVQSLVSRKMLLIVLLLVALVSMIAITWISSQPAYANRGTQKEAEVLGLLRGNLDVGGTTSIRLGFYQSAVEAFFRKPFFGWGLSGWSVYYYGEDKTAYPHNIILELGAEEGLLGLLSFGLLLLAAFMSAKKVLQLRDPEFASIMPVLLLVVMMHLVSRDIESRELFFWIGSTFALARLSVQEHLASSTDTQSYAQYDLTTARPDRVASRYSA